MFRIGRACYKRTYATKYSAKETIDFFKRKNIHDVFSYDYHETETERYIVFKSYKKGFIERGNLNSKYTIDFLETADGITRFEETFCKKTAQFSMADR